MNVNAEWQVVDDLSYELSLTQKLNASFSEAIYVAVGSFGYDSGPEEGKFPNGISFVPVNFVVESIYKKKWGSEVLSISLPAYKKIGSTDHGLIDALPGRSFEKLSRDARNLEMELGDGLVNKDAYRKRLKSIRGKLLSSPEVLEGRAVVVQVSRGSIHITYREADVPIVFGEKYILFLFSELDGRRAEAVLPHMLDLYEIKSLPLVVDMSRKYREQEAKGIQK